MNAIGATRNSDELDIPPSESNRASAESDVASLDASNSDSSETFEPALERTVSSDDDRQAEQSSDLVFGDESIALGVADSVDAAADFIAESAGSEIEDNALVTEVQPVVVERKKAKRARYRNDRLFFQVFLTAVVMDQLTKAIAVFLLGYPGESQSFVSFLGDYFTRIQEFPWRIGSDGYKPAVEVIDGFLRWQLTTNTGAAFSIFSNHPGKLALVSAILIIFLYVLFLKYGRGSNIWPIAFGLQIGGAFGNFVDRARLREVVDFVAVKIPSVIDGRLVWVDFPIFNVADACAVVGTVSIGLMFVTLDIAHSRAVRKARFEIEWMGLQAARDISIVHALDHNRYTAVVLRIEQPPVRVESEAPSDGEEVNETTVADNRVESMPSEDANVIAIIVETETAHTEIGYDE